MGRILIKIVVSTWKECREKFKRFFNRDDNDPYGNNPYVII